MKYLLLWILGCMALVGLGQKHDYVWLSGYESYPKPVYDTGFKFYFATSILDFNQEPVSIKMDSLKMFFSRTNTSYCDSNGILLFYTNGIYIANSLNEKVENGDSLNAGFIQYVVNPSIQQYGYRRPYAVLAFEHPSNPSFYYIIHIIADSLPGNSSHTYMPKVLASYLDMSANFGHGKVLYKNSPVIHDTLDGIGGELAAIRHGNGRDWWVIAKKQNSNCYYRILIDESGPQKISGLKCGGLNMIRGDVGSACASPDGRKYAYLISAEGLNLWDFDRCSGELNNPKTFPLPVLNDSSWWALTGLAFSPNSRFLYVSITKHLYQIDLWAPDPFSNIDTVGIYDGFYLPGYPQLKTYFNVSQLAPNGKIYISNGNALPYYHVINNPDLKGDSCDFQQHSLVLPSPSGGVPSFPNYRLGKLAASPCDTLTGLNDRERAEKEKILKVFPNPATTEVMIDYGFTDWSKPGEVTIEITNDLGQVVHQQTLPRYSGFQKIQVAQWAAGMYQVILRRGGAVVAAQKMVKE